MILISEWLPNPTGSDTAGEWVELWNSGSAAKNLSGWTIKNSSGKKFIFGNKNIDSNEYLVLARSESKLTLKNTDEKLFLYDDKSQLVDKSEIFGTAREGKSFSRNGEIFSFVIPTPGAVNVAPEGLVVVSKNIVFGRPLNLEEGSGNMLWLILACGIIFTAFILISLKTDHALSKLFFERN